MPSSVFDVHLITNPLGPVTLVLLVPEAALVGQVGMFSAAFELCAMRTIFVDGLVATSSTTAIARLAAATSALVGVPPVLGFAVTQ